MSPVLKPQYCPACREIFEEGCDRDHEHWGCTGGADIRKLRCGEYGHKDCQKAGECCDSHPGNALEITLEVAENHTAELEAEVAVLREAAMEMVCPCTDATELGWEDCTEGCPAEPLRRLLADPSPAVQEMLAKVRAWDRYLTSRETHTSIT